MSSNNKNKNYYPLNARISESEEKRLKNYCKAQKRSITEVVRELIRSLPDD
jgi:hypothetical protein